MGLGKCCCMFWEGIRRCLCDAESEIVDVNFETETVAIGGLNEERSKSERQVKQSSVKIIEKIVYVLTVAAALILTFTFNGHFKDEVVRGAVTTAVDGVIQIETSSGAPKVLSSSDIVVPPRGPDQFFVMTHLFPTLEQTQGKCDENPRVKNINCTTDLDCLKWNGTILPGAHGSITGKCVDSTFPDYKGTKVCEIFGWCPVEHDNVMDSTLLVDTRNFVALIKNEIDFPESNLHWCNINNCSDTPRTQCLYNASHENDRFCPKFKLLTIVDGAKQNYSDIAKKGGVIRVLIKWDCNLEESLSECAPVYSFRWINTARPGSEWRLATPSGNITRSLRRARGIRILVTVEGKGRSYAWLNALQAVGGYFAFVAIFTAFLKMFLFCCSGYSAVDTYVYRPPSKCCRPLDTKILDSVCFCTWCCWIDGVQNKETYDQRHFRPDLPGPSMCDYFCYCCSRQRERDQGQEDNQRLNE